MVMILRFIKNLIRENSMQSKKKAGVLISIFLFFGFLLPSPAAAHILASDQVIGAVLHIDPNDNPIVNKVSGFFLEFKDKNREVPTE